MKVTRFPAKLCTKALVSLFFILSAHCLYSQMVFGVDVSDPQNTSGYLFNNSGDAAGSDIYVKYDTGIFDRIILSKGIGYTFTIFNPTANRLIQVSDSLRAAFGYENVTMDSIPNGIAEDDFDGLTLSIQDGRGKILRFWYEEKFNVKLEFSGENLQVLLAYN